MEIHKNKNGVLTESDTREMVRLLGKLPGSEASLTKRRTVLMGGLAGLIDANAWVWAKGNKRKPDRMMPFSVDLKWGFDALQFAKLLKALEQPAMARFFEPQLELVAKRKKRVTHRGQDLGLLVPGSDVYQLWREAGVASLIISSGPVPTGGISGVCFYRHFGRSLFSERESRIVDIILSEVPWLHDEQVAEQKVEEMGALSPRLNTVLNLLLHGWSRKQIAMELTISINTVNGYAKDLYRYFDVHSHAELIRKFVDGDGGDLYLSSGGQSSGTGGTGVGTGAD